MVRNPYRKDWMQKDMDPDCAICMEEMKSTDDIILACKNRHYFHRGCIHAHKKNSNTCPYCRSKMIDLGDSPAQLAAKLKRRAEWAARQAQFAKDRAASVARNLAKIQATTTKTKKYVKKMKKKMYYTEDDYQNIPRSYTRPSTRVHERDQSSDSYDNPPPPPKRRK
jgi:hypothetical protein